MERLSRKPRHFVFIEVHLFTGYSDNSWFIVPLDTNYPPITSGNSLDGKQTCHNLIMEFFLEMYGQSTLYIGRN